MSMAAGSVLVADDEASLRASLCDLLGDMGFRIIGQAADGKEAVSMSAELAPDVALLDLRMPVMDGITAAREIKERSPRTRVVILSAYEEDSLQAEAQEAGVYCYLVKGCGAKLISEVITRALAWDDSVTAPSSL